MKAIVYESYGPPGVLQLKDIEKPVPHADQVLIRVRAASANALDWHFMRGTPFMARLGRGLFKPRDGRLGADMSGVIEVVGENVTRFKNGDEVFGDMYPDPAAFAEYVVMHQDGILANKPQNISFQEAASLPGAGVTALQALRDHGRIRAGQSVLINGASGAVGTFTVQMAKVFGAVITAVCSARNKEMVIGLGADEVIDYNKEDFTKSVKKYDLLIDNVGNRRAGELKRILKPGATCVVVGFTSLPLLIQHALAALAWGNRKVKLMGSAKSNKKDLNTLKEMLQNGQIKAVIEKCYNLAETAEAIRYLETGHARAKVVINI